MIFDLTISAFLSSTDLFSHVLIERKFELRFELPIRFFYNPNIVLLRIRHPTYFPRRDPLPSLPFHCPVSRLTLRWTSQGHSPFSTNSPLITLFTRCSTSCGTSSVGIQNTLKRRHGIKQTLNHQWIQFYVWISETQKLKLLKGVAYWPLKNVKWSFLSHKSFLNKFWTWENKLPLIKWGGPFNERLAIIRTPAIPLKLT